MPRPGLASAVRSLLPGRADVGVFALATVFDVFLFSNVTTARASAPVSTVVAAALLCTAPLLVRRRFPVVVFALLLLAPVLTPLLGIGYRATVGLMVALYTMSGRRPRSLSGPAALVFYVDISVTTYVDEFTTRVREGHPTDGLLVATLGANAIVTMVAWGFGQWARASRQRAEALEHVGRLTAQQAVAAERTRIAGDLHVVISHAVGVMVAQIAGARRVLDADPGRAEQELADAEAAGQNAIGELNRLFGVLRSVGDEPAVGAPVEAAHPLADLPGLLEHARQSGVRPVLTVTGDERPLDRSIELAAYCVVDEAMRNIIEHVGVGTRCEVRLEWDERALEVRVRDDGRGRSSSPSGVSFGPGLTALQERVERLRGSFDAGPHDLGGYEVHAWLPLDAADRDEQAGDHTVVRPQRPVEQA